ncbi:MAG: hypothetical protein M1815_002347 [Lichina confinis]|nr:MAG: hypothetical protein M1815_002347 [Lichina confinis]
MFAGGKNIWVLAASRMLQGFSAANVYTIGLALLTDTVGRDEVGQMMGFALSSANVGVLISPLLGGLVYARAGYIPLFGMALGLICFDIFLRLVMIEKKVAAKYMLPAEENGRYGTFGDGQPTEADRSCDVQQPPDTGAHPSTEDTQNGHVGNGPSDEEHQPLLKKDGPRKSRFNFKTPTVFILLRSPRMLTAILGIFVEVGILSSFDTVLPLFVKRTFVGKLSDRYGPRWVAVTGLLATLPFLVMLRLVDHHSTGQIVLLCTLLSLIGLFLTFVMSPLAADLAGLVEEREKEQPGIFGPYGAYAQVFAVFNCSMAAGTLAFPIWAGFAQATFGWKTMAWSLGLTCGVAAIPVMIFTGGTITKRSKPAMFEREHEGTV